MLAERSGQDQDPLLTSLLSYSLISTKTTINNSDLIPIIPDLQRSHECIAGVVFAGVSGDPAITMGTNEEEGSRPSWSVLKRRVFTLKVDLCCPGHYLLDSLLDQVRGILF